MKNRKQSHFVIMALVAMVIVSMLAIPVSASISPDNVEATLNPGESLIVDKTVTIPDPLYPVKADVIFVFDLTGSMSSVINEAKAKSGDIMAALDATGVDIQYGVVSYMDYPHTYDSCDYSADYGSADDGDYAYALNQSITSDQTAVKDAINALTLGFGADGPQDYTRVMYESYADSAIGWRPGAKRIMVNLGDNVPHDCNLNEGVPGKTGTWTTGGDPGRDEVMGTTDDLDLQTVLADMAANNVILLECHTTTWYEEYWKYWTGITGGDVYITSSTTLVDDVVNAITTGFVVPKVYGLHLKASTGFESWVSAVPAKYDEVNPGATVTFVETIQVPVGTTPGVYTFTVSAMDNKSVSFGDQTDIITVLGMPSAPVPALAPIGIIALISLLCVIGMIRIRRRFN